MKICFTSEGPDPSSDVEPRFGRSQYFIIYDDETGKHEAIDNSENARADSGAGVKSASTVVEKGVDWVACSHIGPRAMQVLREGGVRVCTGCCGIVWDAIEAFEDGELHEVEQADMPGQE